MLAVIILPQPARSALTLASQVFTIPFRARLTDFQAQPLVTAVICSKTLTITSEESAWFARHF
jgi:hypothetical protein